MSGNSLRRAAGGFAQYAGLVGVLAVLVTVFGQFSEHFLERSTLASVANQIPDLTFLAVGMTFVLIVGGIDLSVGSLLALAAAVPGIAMTDWGWPAWAAVPLCVAVGTLCGLANGVISVGFCIPSFIVTLGMLEIARGGAKLVSDSRTLYIGSAIEPFAEPIRAGWLPAALNGLLSPAFLTAVAVVAVGEFVLRRTVPGRYWVAIGTNREAVRMAGIRVAPLTAAVFAVSGLMCGLAAVAQTSLLTSSNPNAAIGIELSAIAACVIGGTSLAGGRGSVVSSFLGSLIIAVLQTGLAQVGVSDANKQIVTGGVIIAAVVLDSLRNRGSRRS